MKAYGAHNTRTATRKAHDVAFSIRQREAEGRAWTWTTYGLDGDAKATQRQLVLIALEREE